MGRQSRRKRGMKRLRAWREHRPTQAPPRDERAPRRARAPESPARRRAEILALVVLVVALPVVLPAVLPPVLRALPLPEADDSILAALLVSLPGCVLAALALWDVVAQLRASRWLPAPCEIHATEVRFDRREPGRRHQLRLYRPLVHYTYEVDGAVHASSRVHSSPLGYSGFREALARIEKYRDGSGRTCYYDPRDPSRAVLDTKPSFGAAAGLAFLAALCFALAAYVAWLH